MQPCGGSHDALDVTRTLGLDIPMGGSFMLRISYKSYPPVCPEGVRLRKHLQ